MYDILAIFDGKLPAVLSGRISAVSRSRLSVCSLCASDSDESTAIDLKASKLCRVRATYWYAGCQYCIFWIFQLLHAFHCVL